MFDNIPKLWYNGYRKKGEERKVEDQTIIACLQAFELLLRARASGLSREECAKFLSLLEILFQNI